MIGIRLCKVVAGWLLSPWLDHYRWRPVVFSRSWDEDDVVSMRAGLHAVRYGLTAIPANSSQAVLLISTRDGSRVVSDPWEFRTSSARVVEVRVREDCPDLDILLKEEEWKNLVRVVRPGTFPEVRWLDGHLLVAGQGWHIWPGDVKWKGFHYLAEGPDEWDWMKGFWLAEQDGQLITAEDGPSAVQQLVSWLRQLPADIAAPLRRQYLGE